MLSEKPHIAVYLKDTTMKSHLEALAAVHARPVSNYFLTLIKRKLAQAEAGGTLPIPRETNA